MVENGLFLRWGRRGREEMVWWERERERMERRGERNEGGIVGGRVGGEVFGRGRGAEVSFWLSCLVIFVVICCLDQP